MNQKIQSEPNPAFDGDVGETQWDEVDGQIRKLNEAIAAVARSKPEIAVSAKVSLWPSIPMLFFHILMALPLAFEVYYLTHPLMFSK